MSEYMPGQSTWQSWRKSQSLKKVKNFVNSWQYPVMTILSNITKNTFERFEKFRESLGSPPESPSETKLKMAQELKEIRQYSQGGLDVEQKIAKSEELREKRLTRTSEDIAREPSLF
ncbi:MAG: hypothetical protein ACTSP1_11405 [Candidatus Freyarchaeota archaeon]